MRFARPLVIAVFVLVMAVTPLSAITSGGIHEAWIGGAYGRGPVRVVLQDRTGLVRAIGTSRLDRTHPRLLNGADPRTLLLNWVGLCPAYRLNLTFSGDPSGYRLDVAANNLSCSFFDPPSGGTIAIILWAPVDAATVVVLPEEES